MWIIDAAGAELWAYFVVLSLTVGIPDIVTDCKGILDGLHKQPCDTTGPKQALARTWQFIRHVLDDDFPQARTKLCWMPSHRSASNLAGAFGSDGQPVTTLMWRANRLADVLAQGIAARHRLPGWALSIVKATGELLQYNAARLGTATHLANNHEEIVTLEGGLTVRRFRRDSTAQRPACKKGSQPRPSPEQPACSSHTTAMPVTSFSAARPPAAAASHQGCKRAADTAVHELRRLVEEETALARCLVAKRLTPASGPTGAERIAKVRERVLARIR